VCPTWRDTTQAVRFSLHLSVSQERLATLANYPEALSLSQS
jgi:hypothetical protein